MKQHELEALVIKQGEYLQAAERAIQDLTARVEEQAVKMAPSYADLDNFQHRVAVIEEKLSEFRDHQDGMNDTLFGVISKSETLTARIEKIETLVLARNASAATKRNMTDEDALRVLTGDLRDLSHKEAAEKIALTYAQVYSCRLEFTFKHVHKDLRDNVKEWKNPWSK